MEVKLNMNHIKISIITPCFNSEKTIRDTIESVLYQTYKNIEYIVIDGGSTDHTVDIIKEYVPRFRGRLRYVSEPDKGIYNAMNKGIRMSTGRLIGIVNSDDYYERSTVEKMAEKYKEGEYQVLYGYMRILSRSKGRYICKNKHYDLLNIVIPHPTCFISRNIYKDFGLYLEGWKMAADYELLLRLDKTKAVKFVCVGDVVTNFRTGGASSGKRALYEASVIRFLYGGLSGMEFIKKILKDLILI